MWTGVHDGYQICYFEPPNKFPIPCLSALSKFPGVVILSLFCCVIPTPLLGGGGGGGKH